MNTIRSGLWSRITVTSLLLIVMTSASLAAEFPVSVVPQGEYAVIGQDLVLQIDLDLPAGAVVSAETLEITVGNAGIAAVLDEPYPLKFLSPTVAGSNPPAYSGQVKIEWVATVLTDAKPVTGDLNISVKAGPHSGSWTAPLKVDFGEEWDQDKITHFIESKGLFLTLLLIFSFGLIMSLSPCIYPMIPITLAVIGAQRKEGSSIAQGLGLSLIYALGLAIVYAAIGFIATTVFSGITAFMQSAWVMAPLAGLLLVLSLSMFGAYTLQAPAWLQNRMGGAGGGGGIFGVLLMGMVAGLIASPCVGPALQGLLLVLITMGNPLFSLIALFVFGMGMSALLIAVGTFPSLLASLPQSGGWMETVNKSMGLLLVAMAFFFLRPGSVLPAEVYWPLTGIVTIIVAVFMGAFDKLDTASSWWDRTRKALGIFVFAAGLYFLAGSFLQNGFLMPSPLASQGHKQVSDSPIVEPKVAVQANQDLPPVVAEPLPAKVPWTVVKTGENTQAFLTEARDKAKAEGKPIMIDFWATWCVYCKKLDKVVWNVPEVVEESQRFVTIKFDATKPDDADMSAIKEEFKVAGLPRVVFIDSRGKILHGRSTGFLEAGQMLEVMKGVR